MWSQLRAIFQGIEAVAKIIGALTVWFAVLILLFPQVETAVNLATAYRFGANGYVYYEIDKDQKPTGKGDLFFLSPGPALYEDIAVGDKLQARNAVNFREGPSTKYRPIFVLRQSDCVIVQKVGYPFAVKEALSGGWLKVVTAACGLFR